MSPVKVACPHCRSALSALPPFAPGLKVKCSCCGTFFALAAQVTARSHPAGASPNGPAPVAVGVTPPPGRPGPPSAGRMPWGVIAGALATLLLVGGGFLAFAVWRDRARNSDNELSQKSIGAVGDENTSATRPAPLPLSAPDDETAKPSQRHFDPPPEQRTRSPRPAEPSPGATALAPARQQAVNSAIDRGVAYLKKKQKSGGTWATGSHPVGNAALPGLTLLECGVPASDPAVSKAAVFVREQAAQLAATYELALAVLFLERLGEAADRPLVQDLALRLVAGQLADGGWTYRCPVLEEAQREALLQHLERLRSDSPADPAKLIADAPSSPDMKPAIPKARHKGKRVRGTGELKHVPALQETLEVRQDPTSPTADNSNTQFAILALWAAQRQGVPVERSLALVVKRFRPCQNEEGGWGYHSGGPQRSPSSPSMTCVGLLGLAVGHGLARDAAPERGTVADPQIQKAMDALGKRVGHPVERGGFDLYFLWSLERVGVLYGLSKIGSSDWYAWGAELLLAKQAKDGNWHGGAYHGSTSTLDTCFALLFLKRANLTHDLTKKIEFLKIEPRREE